MITSCIVFVCMLVFQLFSSLITKQLAFLTSASALAAGGQFFHISKLNTMTRPLTITMEVSNVPIVNFVQINGSFVAVVIK